MKITKNKEFLESARTVKTVNKKMLSKLPNPLSRLQCGLRIC